MLELLETAALPRGIPMRLVAAGSGIWRFGQGAASRHLFAAARSLGFPVAVKPLAAGLGRGVCADIRTEADLLLAHAGAAALSPQGVVVERHIAGLDHRLTVCGGRLTWAVIRHRASVTGDGVHAVQELINVENARRSATDHAERLKPITIDDELVIQLRNQSLTLEAVPAAGASVAMRSVANVARGGTVEALFPPGSDGRIPTVLLVDPVPAALDMVAAALAAGHRVGRTDAAETRLGAAVRCRPGMDLAARVEALVVGTCREILRGGVHGAIEAAAISAALGRMLRRYTLHGPPHVVEQ